jgi:hypothetical protein
MTKFSWLVRQSGIAAIVVVFAFLAGCSTPRVSTDITSFHEWPAQAVGPDRTYRLVRQPAQANSLEHATYEQLMRQELNRAGFIEQANGRFLVGFDYAIGSQVSRVVDPWSRTTVSVGGAWGWPGSGVGLGVGFPIGGWPYGAGVRDIVVYERRLKVVIEDSVQSNKRVFESNLVSLGSNRNLAEVLPLMARGLFSEFPGQSGVTRSVAVETPPAK